MLCFQQQVFEFLTKDEDALKPEFLTDQNDLDSIRKLGASRNDNTAADAIRSVAISTATCHGAWCIASAKWIRNRVVNGTIFTSILRGCRICSTSTTQFSTISSTKTWNRKRIRERLFHGQRACMDVGGLLWPKRRDVKWSELPCSTTA